MHHLQVTVTPDALLCWLSRLHVDQAQHRECATTFVCSANKRIGQARQTSEIRYPAAGGISGGSNAKHVTTMN